MPDDFRVSITNAPGKDAYPISSFTWLLIPAQIQDAGEKGCHQGLPGVDDDRRAASLRTAGLRQLPKEVVAKEQKAIAMVQ